MTNNDKAIDALKEYEANQAYDNAPKMAEAILDEYAPLFIQALTPQSSADMGRVLRARVEGMREQIPEMPKQALYKSYAEYLQDLEQASDEKVVAQAVNRAIDSVLRILDEVIGRE